MNFSDYEARLKVENRWMKLLVTGSLVVMTILLVLMWGERKYYVYQGKEIFEERLLSSEICRLSILSVLRGDPNADLVLSELKAILDKEPYELQVEKVLALKSIEQNQCKMVLKAEGKIHGLKLTLIENDKFPFFYKLAQIDEISVDKEKL